MTAIKLGSNKLMKTWMRFAIIVMGVNVGVATSSFAALEGVNLTYPEANFLTTASTAVNYTYTGPNGLFSVSAPLTTMIFSSSEGSQLFSGGSSMQINFAVDNTGALAGPTANDLVLQGTVTEGTTTYSGVLLTGEATGFGFVKHGTIAQYDFQFAPTGGLLKSLFNGEIGVALTSEGSTFNNDFTANFNGQAKGTVGSETISSAPEPSIYGACTGALTLLPLGASVLRTLRKRQVA
jgi:hypothetical protein